VTLNGPAPAERAPFADFAGTLKPPSALRAAVTAATRRPEQDCVASLLDLAALPKPLAEQVAGTARRLVLALRAKPLGSGVDGLIHEYTLSSQEGIALMCLAEALLRIPDDATRDALIRDKLATADWRAHLGNSPSLFVNATTWGLLVTGHLTATRSENSLSAALTRLLARGGEPIIRKGVDLAMRIMGQHFVCGQTIEEALGNSHRLEARGFRYSYDMLGEAAMTAEAAAQYLGNYETAIQAIGKAATGRGVIDGPGISIKLSALHPRYTRAQQSRVMAELLPRLKALALLARSHDIGLNIDAEEADRLEISLDLLESLALDADLAGWQGLGFVIQAYGKRCAAVVDWLIDLGHRANRRLMVRLVKGAYWDAEIKRAQVDGMADFPVFTRKPHTDVSYLACACKLLAAPAAVFPQFATHNAQTLATVMAMAGPDFHNGQYEFQCLHGMGEPLYEEVVGPHKLGRPCRIYAPVGTHETLLAYLVRRLLENGANTSFVNRIADPATPVATLVADPVTVVRAMRSPGIPHERITLPRALYGAARYNSSGLDLADDTALGQLGIGLDESVRHGWTAAPYGASVVNARPVLNPADHRDIVGYARDATAEDIAAALVATTTAGPTWAAWDAGQRAALLRAGADAMEARMPVLIGLIVREAGKSFANAVAEVREAVDFLRYYATEAERTLLGRQAAPLGPVACISPWNFPLAIFTGQVAAALVAGNTVLAKPAEETPLIAAEAVRLLHQAGVPDDVLRLLPGDGPVGAALVADVRVQGVVFTGSTTVARLIQRQLAGRLTEAGQPVPLIAETGGLNALVVDSSALAEQVVADVIASAFDSAGQRCSALRILCLQDDVAETVLGMLQGAMRELRTGNPDRLAVDIGPVITDEARDEIGRHVAAMRARGHAVTEFGLPEEAAHGSFVAPTIIEVGRVSDVEREVFGPVLHVVRYRRRDLDRLVSAINEAGYGLTFGLHTRIDETIARVTRRVRAGNIYVNRNIIGAVVGVQPFGGSGLSGTGPKAGGPFYLGRLLARRQGAPLNGVRQADPDLPVLQAFIDWLRAGGETAIADGCDAYLSDTVVGASMELPGPVGERNVYAVHPRGRVAAVAATLAGLLWQLGAILATGNSAVVVTDKAILRALEGMPKSVAARIATVGTLDEAGQFDAVLFEGDNAGLRKVAAWLAERDGPISPLQAASSINGGYDLHRLLEERTISINTAAAGGNASLMSIG
jgi:RHH-type transcriptional regulator, proline utilization regulon repressor / proline dehydrogenase / delta 1-pyrroline-5-carboxylate dehydrogenase